MITFEQTAAMLYGGVGCIIFLINAHLYLKTRKSFHLLLAGGFLGMSIFELLHDFILSSDPAYPAIATIRVASILTLIIAFWREQA